MSHHTTRTIAYLCELFHPPLRADAQAIQKLHNALFESGSPPYSSFAVTPMAPLLTNPGTRPGFVSQVAFLGDRMQFREELGGLTCEVFAARVRDIAERTSELRGLQALRGQQVTIRSLVNPRHFPDSRAFLRGPMLGIGEALSAFEREPGVFGLRLGFPPGDGEATGHALRVESYVQDPRSLFIEIQSGYGGLVLPEGLEGIEANVAETYRFLEEQVLAFIDRFDRPAEG